MLVGGERRSGGDIKHQQGNCIHIAASPAAVRAGSGGSGRPDITVAHWRHLSHAFSAPKVALRLLIPSGARPQIPHSSLPPVWQLALFCTHVQQTLPKAQEPSEVVTVEEEIPHGHPTPGVGTDWEPGQECSGGETPPAAAVGPQPSRTSRSCPVSGGLQSLGEKHLPRKETEPDRGKKSGARHL